MFKSYINPEENREANKKLPRLMVEGLLLGGSGLGVLALIFEIAADAFSVAAYQTLLAIHGAEGHHQIAILAFIVLSALLFFGIVPAYKAGSYLRPNAGGSGPLVEAIGPPRMRWLSWIGTSLFFIDAVLTIIISSISAADVTMLIYPELQAYRILLSEVYAFFIMSVLVLVGPRRAVPLFLIGGGAFTLFTLMALSVVGYSAVANPEWAFLTEGIVSRLEANGVVEHVVRAQESFQSLSTIVFFQFFMRSMSSAMLGFSGYEVIPASGKHAAKPKWKVINTALTLAAVFLIGTGVIQLLAANQWKIPSTEGYSTLLIEYEIVAAQMFGEGVSIDDVRIMPEDEAAAEAYIEEVESHGGHANGSVDDIAYNLAIGRSLDEATEGTTGGSLLFLAGILLAIILLLAQGGGYIGGAAVAANAARLGRLPAFFADDRIGVAVIWGIAAVLIPIIRQVVIVEAYYAFGFVSAFIITSTTVYFVRDDALLARGIEPGSAEAKSLKFAGLRGMIASYLMGIILITQKTDALLMIVIFGALITLFQLWYAHGRIAWSSDKAFAPVNPPGTSNPDYEVGVQLAYDMARQRGIMDATNELINSGALNHYNVEMTRIKRLIGYLYNLDSSFYEHSHADHGEEDHHDDIEEPSVELEATHREAYAKKDEIAAQIEKYSDFGVFMFINNYHRNWVDPEHGRDEKVVQQAMLDILYANVEHDVIWDRFGAFEPTHMEDPIWQFSRSRYLWAKDQWPNLSDRITTIWTLQDFGLIPMDVDVRTVVSVADGRSFKKIKIPTKSTNGDLATEKGDLDEE